MTFLCGHWIVVAFILYSNILRGANSSINPFSALKSTDNGQFSIAIHQSKEQKQDMEISTDFGENWTKLKNSPETQQWISLSATKTNEFTLAREAKGFYVIKFLSNAEAGKRWLLIPSLKSFPNTTFQALASSSTTAHMCAVGGRNILVSSDNGASWNVSLVLKDMPPQDNKIDGKEVLIETSETGQYSYVLSYVPWPKKTTVANVKSAFKSTFKSSFVCILHASSDFGASWQVIHQFLTKRECSATTSLLISGTGQDITIHSGANLVLHSSNFGKTFVNLLPNLRISDNNGDKVVGVVKCYDNPELDADDCIGEDNDEHDKKNTLLNMVAVSAAAMSRNGLHLVIAGHQLDTMNTLLVLSHDGGHSWSIVYSPATDNAGRSVHALTIDDKGQHIIGLLSDDTKLAIDTFSTHAHKLPSVSPLPATGTPTAPTKRYLRTN